MFFFVTVFAAPVVLCSTPGALQHRLCFAAPLVLCSTPCAFMLSDIWNMILFSKTIHICIYICIYFFLQNQSCSCFAKNDRNTNTKGPPSFSLASKSQRGSSLGWYDKVKGCAIHFIKKVDSESQLPRTEQSCTEPRKQNAHAPFVHPAFRWSVYSNASRGKTRARDFKSGEPRPCCKCHKQCIYIYM